MILKKKTTKKIMELYFKHGDTNKYVHHYSGIDDMKRSSIDSSLHTS